jgi:hypothetical protein
MIDVIAKDQIPLDPRFRGDDDLQQSTVPCATTGTKSVIPAKAGIHVDLMQ